MRTFKEIKQDYRFTPDDERRLAGLRPVIDEHAEEILSTVSLWFKGTKGAAQFFTDETLQKHVFESQKDWFLLLFSGKYDNAYYDRLIKIGMAHMRRNVDVHYLHRMANIIKNSCTGVLSKTDDSREEMISNIVSVGKIIDISLNVITTAYIQEEMRIY